MLSPRERGGDLARFYTVTEPRRHPRGHTVYKVTARVSQCPAGPEPRPRPPPCRLPGAPRAAALPLASSGPRSRPTSYLDFKAGAVCGIEPAAGLPMGILACPARIRPVATWRPLSGTRVGGREGLADGGLSRAEPRSPPANL